MSNIRPYISLDLETTGINTEKSQILQFGMVLDDGETPIEELHHYSCLVKHDALSYAENYALKMNAWIFEEYTKKESKHEIVNIYDALALFREFVAKGANAAREWDIQNKVKNPKGKIQLAGKNVATFDYELLKQASKKVGIGLPREVDFRFIDVGSLYYDFFGSNVGLPQINKLIGYKEVTHNALDDAFNVVAAIRSKLGYTI